jgi:hypothetical protein
MPRCIAPPLSAATASAGKTKNSTVAFGWLIERAPPSLNLRNSVSVSGLNQSRPADSAFLTPDGRYIVVRGRLWRATNPNLTAQERRSLTASLMEARRSVGVAKRKNDVALPRAARQEVQAVKVALGERGPVWWDDRSPDYNRRLVKNTPYAQWYAETSAPERESGGDQNEP